MCWAPSFLAFARRARIGRGSRSIDTFSTTYSHVHPPPIRILKNIDSVFFIFGKVSPPPLKNNATWLTIHSSPCSQVLRLGKLEMTENPVIHTQSIISDWFIVPGIRNINVIAGRNFIVLIIASWPELFQS